MQKKIAMISYHTCPLASDEGKETGGMNVYVLELSMQLAKLGYQVDMFTRCHDEGNCKVTQVSPNLRLLHLLSGPADAVPKKSLINHLDEFVDNFLQFTQDENLQYDLLHCHYYLSGLIGLKLNERLNHRLPIIATFHTLALMKNLVARSEAEQETQARIDAEFLLAQQVDKIVAPSESAKQYLEYLYGAPEAHTIVVPPGFNKGRFRPINQKVAKEKIGADKDHKIILFVGRIEPLKGIDVLMYAMQILRRRLSRTHPKLCLCLWVLGGDISPQVSEWSTELRRLERLKQTLKLESFVKFVGQKPQDDLPYYYNAAEVVVMPSNYESFGMAALEAMACGTPIVTTNVAGISSFLGERQKALVTSAHNPLLLASHIEHLLTDNIAHEQLGQEIHQKVQDLTWEDNAAKVATIYKTLYEKV